MCSFSRANGNIDTVDVKMEYDRMIVSFKENRLNLGPKMAPSSTENRSKLDAKIDLKLKPLDIDFSRI